MLSQSESELEAIRLIASDSDSDWDSICLWFRLADYIDERKYFGEGCGEVWVNWLVLIFHD